MSQQHQIPRSVLKMKIWQIGQACKKHVPIDRVDRLADEVFAEQGPDAHALAAADLEDPRMRKALRAWYLRECAKRGHRP